MMLSLIHILSAHEFVGWIGKCNTEGGDSTADEEDGNGCDLSTVIDAVHYLYALWRELLLNRRYQ